MGPVRRVLSIQRRGVWVAIHYSRAITKNMFFAGIFTFNMLGEKMNLDSKTYFLNRVNLSII